MLDIDLLLSVVVTITPCSGGEVLDADNSEIQLLSASRHSMMVWCGMKG